MKKTTYIFGAIFMASHFALGGEVANIKVKGMVCSFCSQGIKKKFAEQKAVSNIEVNLDEKWVRLSFKEGESLDDSTLTNLITAAGYNVESIERKTDSAKDEKK